MVALGLTLFGFAMILAIVIGSIAARNSKEWDEAKHVNLIGNQNSNGKHTA